MKSIIYTLAAFFVVITSSCGSSKGIQYIVASETVDCTGVGPQKCLLIKKAASDDWQYFYSNIEGFNHQNGYEYVLEVKEDILPNVPADASAIKYTLIKEVSKTAKTSENLPQATADIKGVQCTGKVLSVKEITIGRGAALGKNKVQVVKLQVVSSNEEEINQGDIISAELIADPKVTPVVGREYVFKAKDIHPAHADGVYLLETNVLDLTR